MNPQIKSSINFVPAQVNNPVVEPASNGNGNGHSKGDRHPNGKRTSLIHLARRSHATICGRDLWFYSELTVTAKVTETTCRHCRTVHERRRILRRQARAWRKEHTPQSATLKQAAHFPPSGLADLETAFQHALEKAEKDSCDQAYSPASAAHKAEPSNDRRNDQGRQRASKHYEKF
jgi:hypothetical protein